jgi:restriction endonuclease
MELSLPPNSSTVQVTSDIIDNADAITADKQQMSLPPTNTHDTNAAVYEEVIDQLYNKADLNTVTIKDIVKSVANHFNLSKEAAKSTKQLIKKRLMYLTENSNVVNGINNNSRHTLTQGEGSSDDDKQQSISTLTEGVTLTDQIH